MVLVLFHKEQRTPIAFQRIGWFIKDKVGSDIGKKEKLTDIGF